MLLKFLNIVKVAQKVIFTRNVHKLSLKMNKAYLRHLTETNQFEFAFRYVDKNLKVDRQFNFNRRLSESVETFLSRIATNVEKVANKKLKKRKKPNEEQVQDSEYKLALDLYLDDSKVSGDTACEEVFLPNKKIVLKMQGEAFEIIINSPWVESIALPTSILATFPVYPSKFETVFTEKPLSAFVWSKSKDQKSWTDVGDDFIYFPGNQEVEHYLRVVCTPRNETAEGPAVETVSTCKVEASPGRCPFETRHEVTKRRAEGTEFRVVTYNILADYYCDSDYTREVLHPYCPPYALTIDYRKQLLLKEITGYNADIICLQEVDRSVFKSDFEPFLNHLNYGGIITLKGNEVAEGLGFFYNKNRFRQLDTQRLVLSEHISTSPLFSDVWDKVSKKENLSARILARSTTLQINIVESLERDEVLVVANIHLYFHPDADHIRLLHGAFAVKYLEDFTKNLKMKLMDKRISLIFCGDFNSVPECGIYRLYTTGEVPKDFIDFQSNKEEAVEDVELRQSFKLGSACGTPTYTNYTAGFNACLDYIFHETSNLGVSQVVPMPSHEEVIQHTALPSIVFPSDHIALVCDLKWL